MKALFTRLIPAIEKGLHIATALSLLFWVHPALAHAEGIQDLGVTGALVFNIEQNINENSRIYTEPAAPSLSYEEAVKNDPLTKKVQEYLTQRGSPYAPCAYILLQQPSWKKIVSLSNAESALGKRTVPGTHNYWGVMAGKKLKKMGNDPCEAIVNMQTFLNDFPRNSLVKYKDMPLDCGRGRKCMNGLYKQPYRVHWTINNTVIISLLDKFEQEANHERVALASVQPLPVVSAATNATITVIR